MYLLLDKNQRVKQMISDIDPIFPDKTIDQLYSKEFIDKLQYVDNDMEIDIGYKYNEETDVWEYVDAPDISCEYVEQTTTEARLAKLEYDNKILKEQLEDAIRQLDLVQQ